MLGCIGKADGCIWSLDTCATSLGVDERMLSPLSFVGIEGADYVREGTEELVV